MLDVYHGTAPEYLSVLYSRCNDHRLRSSTRGDFAVWRTRRRLADTARLLLQDLLRGSHSRFAPGTLNHILSFVANWKLSCLLYLVDLFTFKLRCMHCVVVRRCWAPVEWRRSELLWWWWWALYILCCRVSETESLINSHLYIPRCVTARSPLPSVCNCGDDNVPACLYENSIFDRSLPTITYVTSMTDTCFHSAQSRYVYPFILAPHSKHLAIMFQVVCWIMLYAICVIKKTKATNWLSCRWQWLRW